MKGLMTSLRTSTGRPMTTCPYCDQRMDATRERTWWRRIMTGLVYAWVIGLGVLAAEIIIEGRVIAEQWAMLDRVVKILELRAGARGR